MSTLQPYRVSIFDQWAQRLQSLSGIEIGRAHPVHGNAASLERWTGLDVMKDGNRVLGRVVHPLEHRHGRRADQPLAALGDAFGRLLAMTLAVVRLPFPLGVGNGAHQPLGSAKD